MTVGFRIFLLILAIISFYFVIENIRKSKLIIADCIFWFLFSLLILLLAVFPGIAIFFANLLGIQSPVNLVYLIMIGLLLALTFKQTIRISQLETKIKNIVQDITIERHDK